MIEYKEVQVPADGKPKPDAQKRATLPAGPHARSKAEGSLDAPDTLESADTPEKHKSATLPAGPHARSKVKAKDKSSGTGTLPFGTEDDPETRSE
ncbi:hypothetical protein [Rhizobium sp. FY34]|uniref:hypothetical protein n=1 Tax=Rhizobium sp. FY34 TaxID=2562309 RepID=UPI0010C03EB2|nr:hypothetical protein [Rhizobium sp. FY34]